MVFEKLPGENPGFVLRQVLKDIADKKIDFYNSPSEYPESFYFTIEILLSEP